MAIGKYGELHTHSSWSDGKYPVEQLIELAIANHIGILAITDHNRIMSLEEFQRLQELYKDRIILVQGSEVSLIYETSDGELKEIHMVLLFKDPARIRFLENRNMDRKGYIHAIKEALLKEGMEIPDYDELKKCYPETEHLGRKHIADWMYKHGLVSSVDAAFDIYIGGFGECRAFVDSAPFRSGYGLMQDTIKEILNAGGDTILAMILAHPFYYKLSEEELFRLVREFKDSAGELAAIEVLYAKYTEEQRAYLKDLADGMAGEGYKYHYSVASDYHGQSETDTLDNKFPMEMIGWLLERL